jgi:hypothetical protein
MTLTQFYVIILRLVTPNVTTSFANEEERMPCVLEREQLPSSLEDSGAAVGHTTLEPAKRTCFTASQFRDARYHELRRPIKEERLVRLKGAPIGE